MIFQALQILGVILAIAYLLLAARESIWCWLCAIISSFIYVYLFWQVGLLMESMLNIFYIAMAIVGYLQWRYGGGEHEGLNIRTLKPWQHVLIIFLILSLAWLNGWFMQNYTAAAWPYVDSFTTWASVLTTFMVIYKILENWIYWFVIDGISIYLYIDRGLYLTAFLFLAYVIIVVFGFISWRKKLIIH
ncbi:MAG: nicotinamide mononucleotide transporter [SAR86 cluster bacterium]|uniref:Nicotinamide riboside transporter PnuC n=1 Tax=SAR86 cluster bacterium TaxID=2030880 RepID=A0A2A5C6U4_9GAMM|nr:MAG: nicotinamide mononucleotide transporter [SAR86 cluster bacterium]